MASMDLILYELSSPSLRKALNIRRQNIWKRTAYPEKQQDLDAFERSRQAIKAMEDVARNYYHTVCEELS